MMSRAASTTLILVVLSSSFLTACKHDFGRNYETRRVERQEEAGAVHVAVVGVAKWSDVVDDLTTRFPIDEKGALELSIPTTLREERQIVDALRAAFRIALPTSSFSDVVERMQPAEGAPTRIRTTREEDQSGSLDSVPEPANRLDASTLTPRPLLSGDTGRDPLMVYNNARTLMQSVKLLNRSIKDVAVRKSMVPYLVTMQITVMPFARRQPYDAYSYISFFSGSSLDDFRTLQSGMGQDESVRNPVVIPLLATDNLEAARQSFTHDLVRQFAFAASGGYAGVTGTLDVDKFKRTMEAVLGEELNSLLTIGRLSDNTLAVRLGAMNQSGSRYAMVPRAHTVSIVLLAPAEIAVLSAGGQGGQDGASGMRLVAKTQLRDVKTGNPLEERSGPRIERILKDLATAHSSKELDRSVVNDLVKLAQRNDFEGFLAVVDALDKTNTPIATPEAFWVEATELYAGGLFSQTAFDIPRSVAETLPPEQPVLINDDGRQVVVKLSGGASLEAGELMAWLEPPGMKAAASTQAKPSNEATLPDAIRVDDGKSSVVAVFPSLVANAQRTPSPKATRESGFRVVICKKNGSSYEKCEWNAASYFAKPEPKKASPPPASVDVPAGVVIADSTGKGTVQVVVHRDAKAKGTFLLTMKGAGHAATQGADVAVSEAGAYKILKSGVISLSLTNLSERVPLEFGVVKLGDDASRAPVGAVVMRSVEVRDGTQARAAAK